MYYTLHGLGALPPWPNSGLAAGHEWVRYLIGAGPQAGQQWQSCPAGASFGCTMSGGYAWGQRPAGIGEHNFIYIAPPTQTSTGEAQVMPDLQKECRDAIFNWARREPQGACLNDDEYHKLIEWCVAWRSGNMTDYGERRAKLIADACVKRECERMLEQWSAAFPDQAACFGYEERVRALRICFKGKTGAISGPEADQRLRDLIAGACEPVAAPPPAPPPQDAPGSPSTLPADETLPPDLLYPDDMPSDGGGTTPSFYDMQFPANGNGNGNGNGDGAGRFLGPIVGIGLIAAVGLTIARTAKKRR
jgi:hypothetical protein